MPTTKPIASLTQREIDIIWIHCWTIGATYGVTMATQALRDLRAGHLDTLALGWSAGMIGEVPLLARKAAEQQLDGGSSRSECAVAAGRSRS